MRIRSQLKKRGLQAAREISDRIQTLNRKYDALWEYLQRDMDRYADAPGHVQRFGAGAIISEVVMMNSIHSMIVSVTAEATQFIEVEYGLARTEANKAIRQQWLRDRVLAAAKFKCAHCGCSDSLCIDHIVPVSAGGINEQSNLQALCVSCNSRKAAGERRGAGKPRPKTLQWN